MIYAYFALVAVVAGCAGYLVGEVNCARHNHVWPWHE